MPKFKKGDIVKVKKSVKKPSWGWGTANNLSVGVVLGYKSNGVLEVNFPEQQYWMADEDEMVKAGKKEAKIQASRKPITRNTLRLYG